MLEVQFKKPFKLGIAEWDMNNTAESIEIPEPNGTMSDYLGDLEQQQGFAYANSMKLQESVSEEQVKEAQEAKKDDEKSDPEQEAAMIVTQLTMGGADMKLCYRVLKKCLSHGSNRAKINGDKVVDKNIVELLPHRELRRLLGFYILNFTNILD